MAGAYARTGSMDDLFKVKLQVLRELCGEFFFDGYCGAVFFRELFDESLRGIVDGSIVQLTFDRHVAGAVILRPC